MAELKFPDTNFKAEAARTRARAKTARTAMLAGLVAALDELSDEGDSAFELQRSLGRGAARSQSAEMKRLIAKHGADHPYVAAAQARIETLGNLTGDMGSLTRGARHLIDSFSELSVFHGYVLNKAGNAAPGMIVELRLAMRGDVGGSVPASAIRRYLASTDEEGYFRINLAQQEGAANTRKKATTKPEQAASGTMSSLFGAMRNMKDMAVQTLVHTTVDREAAAKAEPMRPKDDTAAAADDQHVTFVSEARILDGREKGTVLYTDPAPPEFQGQVRNAILELRSQFRIYSLP
jgi:hypothetical protein